MSEGNNDNWEMPKPVFRSSTGSLPKSFEETISQSFSPESDTVEIDEDDDILGVMPPSDAGSDLDGEPSTAAEIEAASPEGAQRPTVRALPLKPQAKPAGARSFLAIFLMIAVLAAAIVAGLVYYLTTLNGTDRNF